MSLTQEALVATVAALTKKAAEDLQFVQERGVRPLKPLKLRCEPDEIAKVPASKTKAVKTEPATEQHCLVKQEQQEQELEKPIKEEHQPEGEEAVQKSALTLECLLGKQDLLELHGLKALPHNSHKKKFPVFCPHCDTVIEGRNRAKISQHIEHRKLWRASQGVEICKPVITDMDAESRGIQVGQCGGLRLMSSFGQKTRLGSDLFPVWQIYTQYAFLERTFIKYLMWGLLVLVVCVGCISFRDF